MLIKFPSRSPAQHLLAGGFLLIVLVCAPATPARAQSKEELPSLIGIDPDFKPLADSITAALASPFDSLTNPPVYRRTLNQAERLANAFPGSADADTLLQRVRSRARPLDDTTAPVR